MIFCVNCGNGNLFKRNFMNDQKCTKEPIIIWDNN